MVQCLFTCRAMKTLNAVPATKFFGQNNKRMYFMRATFCATILPRRLRCVCHQCSVSSLVWLYFFLQLPRTPWLKLFRGWCTAAHNVSKGHQIHSVSVLRCYITILPVLILAWQYVSDCSGESSHCSNNAHRLFCCPVQGQSSAVI